jgi:hypothetical protein
MLFSTDSDGARGTTRTWFRRGGGALLVIPALVLMTGGSRQSSSVDAPGDGPVSGTAAERGVNEARHSRSLHTALEVVSQQAIQYVKARPATPARVSRTGDSRAAVRLPTWVDQCQPTTRHLATDHPNGKVAADELCRVPRTSHRLHHDAARTWWRLNIAYARRFGEDLCVTDSYRSYEAQAQLFGTKPDLAATPGTSNHGWGVAVDLCGGVQSYSSAQHRWLQRNGSRFGWVNPSWAQASGSKPEPWHWEYVG